MKVAITNESKKCITMEEIKTVKELIKSMKEVDIYEEALRASRLAGDGGSYEILKATAEISKNSRIYDYYDNGTGHLDIWLTVYAYNEYYGFYNIGVYLSDLWQLGSDNVDETRSHMFILAYTRNT
jgi:hypothetical protein